MTDSSIHNFSNETPDESLAETPEEMAALRSLLLGFEQSELEQLQERLNNPNVNAEDLSRLLPEAIILRSMQDKLLSEAIVPTVEDAIHSSVKKDLNILSEAMFPVMAPAIRKAIATALEATLQSFNETIEHSISPQSFKWRLEARQTGKSLAEVVLLRTLIYQVEQVFLIHQETGIVLHHIVQPGANVQDADLVSAMLTAIQSFIQDSFEVNKNDSLEALQFGEVTIWLEKGPKAVLAGVIRGHPPKDLKFIFQESLEKIHIKFHKYLHHFKGDTSAFETSQSYLEPCLQAQYKKPNKKKHYPVVGVFVSILVIALGTVTFFSLRDRQRWAMYLEALNTEPGIIVTKTEKRNGKFFVSGLRDPLAKDPNLILKITNIPRETVIENWKPYASLETEFTTIRAKKLLQPPATVEITLDQNGTLTATGSAPQQWIIESRKLLRGLPGVTKFNEENLVSIDFKQIELSKRFIEKQWLFFDAGETDIKPGQEQKLEYVVKEINKLTDVTKLLNKNIRIQIIGRTAKVKGEPASTILSKKRADKVLSALTMRGLKSTKVSTISLSPLESLSMAITTRDNSIDLTVFFKVIVTNSGKSKANNS
jgi:outer membrane protein OmpA-like peptidoglycan-associated protein